VGTEDQELVRAALQGAEPEAQRAFAALVDRWKGPLYRFLQRRLHHAEDAEDLTFRAMFEAWRSLGSLRGEFRPWLFGIGWNLLAKHYAGKGVRLEPSPIDQALMESQPVMEDASARLDLREALGLLPPETLRLLREKFEAGLSYRELEKKEGIPASTLRERLTAACDRLEEILRKRGYWERFAREAEARREDRAANGHGHGGGA
jgi:RNA polymerase sigma-70 factor (ECF subfamily)